MALVFQNIYLMVFSYIFTGLISTFINAAPNKRVIDYSYLEQIKDIAPAFLLSLIAGSFSLCVAHFNLPSIFTIFFEALVMASVYIGLSSFLHLEAFEYLINTARDFLGAKRR